MKKLFFAALSLAASTAFAEQVVVMERSVPLIYNGYSQVSTRFYMDQKSGQGYVKANVTERRHYGGRHGGMTYTNLFTDQVSVPGLILMGDQAVYQGAEGNVVCGTMGVSRVFKVPTLYLSGNCTLSSVLVRENRNSNKLIVTLTTK